MMMIYEYVTYIKVVDQDVDGLHDQYQNGQDDEGYYHDQ